MDWLKILSVSADILGIIGFLGTIFALLAWLQSRSHYKEYQAERKRQNKEITIRLEHGPEFHEMPVKLRRAEFTRAEILGRLGMIPTKEPTARFSIDSINTYEFLRRVNEIIDGDINTVLSISCTEEEFNQFNIHKQTSVTDGN